VTPNAQPQNHANLTVPQNDRSASARPAPSQN